MPTYEYRCDACGHEFEEFQSIKAGALRKCPRCKKSKLKRLIGTGAGVIFKGSGFYETDYRSESYKSAAKADKPAAESPAKSQTKTESKPAASPSTDSKSSKSMAPAAPKSPKK